MGVQSSVTRYIWRWQAHATRGAVIVSLKVNAPTFKVGDEVLIAMQPFDVIQVVSNADAMSGQTIVVRHRADSPVVA